LVPPVILMKKGPEGWIVKLVEVAIMAPRASGTRARVTPAAVE